MRNLPAQCLRAAVVLIPGTVALAAPAAAQPTGAGPELAMELSEGAVTVTGVSPGGEVGWAVVGRELRGGVPRLVWNGGTAADEDGDGTVELPAASPVMAVWLAVDLEAGHWTVASPPPFEPPALLAPGLLLAAGPPTRPVGIRQTAGSLILVLVRPGEAPERGLWHARVHDGEPGDELGESGSIGLGVSSLEPLAASPPGLSELRAGDVALLVHPRTLASAVLAVGPPEETGGR